MEKDKEQIIEYLEKASVIILSLLFVLFPLLFTNITTDLFLLPKQALLIFAVGALMLLYGAKTFISEKVRIKRTPFDMPIILFLVAVLLSAIFSVARYDSIANFIPLLFAGISFFAISYNIRNERSLFVLVASLLVGGALTSVVSILSFFKIYIFTFDFAKFQTFSTIGSTLDQAIYIALLIPLAIYFLYPYAKKGKSVFKIRGENLVKVLTLSVSTLLILAGTLVSTYILINLQKPVLLPINTGFQTAFAAISQDAVRVVQGFLFGSGYGEFSIAFMRFKQAAFNANPDIWNLTFFRSSSYALEIVTTTGLLGTLAFLLLILRLIKERPLFIPLILFAAAAFVLPFGFYHVVLFFFMLGIYSGARSLSNNARFFEVDLQLTASKRGFFVISMNDSSKQEKYSRSLSTIVLSLIVAFCLVFGYLAYDYASGNVMFQKSLVAASQNNGSVTYDYQSKVLNSYTGRYVDAYHRVFSQTNLALANSLASSVPQGSSPSAQTTQTIYTLVQQSINSGRNATTVSPINSINWQTLSSIYRALIGFGQNADSFAVLAAQQATLLDPSNPSEYINLGGIYYQLGLWDKALEQFQAAINLKPDYANAHYNYAYALIQKGDLQGGLTSLQTVKSLIANDKTNLEKLNKEISDLEAKIGQVNPITNTQVAPSQEQQQLELNQSQTLPSQNPPVKIPGPSDTPTPTPSPTDTPTPQEEVVSPSPASTP